eukprot:Platyproteum_vivax@DN14530_c0_g1_i1.p1
MSEESFSLRPLTVHPPTIQFYSGGSEQRQRLLITNNLKTAVDVAIHTACAHIKMTGSNLQDGRSLKLAGEGSEEMEVAYRGQTSSRSRSVSRSSSNPRLNRSAEKGTDKDFKSKHIINIKGSFFNQKITVYLN